MSSSPASVDGASPRVGLLHPGAMGATVGRALLAGRCRVAWASEGRSAATSRRAGVEGFADAGTIDRLVSGSDIVVSVCPPHAALAVATAVAACGFRGLFLDANAVSPATLAEVGAVIAAGGGDLVDGGIVGPPADRPGTTRIYVSGPAARPVAEMFGNGLLEPIVVEGPAGRASALKMAYAAYTKGSGALLLAIRALAEREGVDDVLLAEWGRSLPELPDRSDGLLRRAGRKAWRFEGEMHEIADTLASAGLPDGFHRAAAEIYRRLSVLRDVDDPTDAATTLDLLLGGGSPEGSGR